MMNFYVILVISVSEKFSCLDANHFSSPRYVRLCSFNKGSTNYHGGAF